MKYRTESDTLGEVKIPENSLWGPQTQRSIENFKIGKPSSMPIEIIKAYSILKKSCAQANHESKILDNKKMKLISEVCDEILEGAHDNEFPLVIWQTVNETIKLTSIANVPNPSGDIPNHQSASVPPPNHPNLNFVI